MEAKELRIGNIVSDGLFKFKVTGIKDEFVYGTDDIERVGIVLCEHTLELENTIGLILNEEWLLELGFKKAGYNNQDKLVFSIDNGEVWVLQNIVTKKFNISEYKLDIKYVHQLQNLFFALTGKELIWK